MTDENSSDPVLTDDEKGALLDGMSSGEIEVHSSNGPSYASVTDFEVGPRFRIVTNSYPRLQNLNRQFAAKIGKHIEVLLNTECDVTFDHIDTCTYSEFGERHQKLALLIEFAPKPLQGSGQRSVSAGRRLLYSRRSQRGHAVLSCGHWCHRRSLAANCGVQARNCHVAPEFRCDGLRRWRRQGHCG